MIASFGDIARPDSAFNDDLEHSRTMQAQRAFAAANRARIAAEYLGRVILGMGV